MIGGGGGEKMEMSDTGDEIIKSLKRHGKKRARYLLYADEAELVEIKREVNEITKFMEIIDAIPANDVKMVILSYIPEIYLKIMFRMGVLSRIIDINECGGGDGLMKWLRGHCTTPSSYSVIMSEMSQPIMTTKHDSCMIVMLLYTNASGKLCDYSRYGLVSDVSNDENQKNKPNMIIAEIPKINSKVPFYDQGAIHFEWHDWKGYFAHRTDGGPNIITVVGKQHNYKVTMSWMPTASSTIHQSNPDYCSSLFWSSICLKLRCNPMKYPQVFQSVDAIERMVELNISSKDDGVTFTINIGQNHYVGRECDVKWAKDNLSSIEKYWHSLYDGCKNDTSRSVSHFFRDTKQWTKYAKLHSVNNTVHTFRNY